MKTITYGELIKLIEQGKPPRKIRVIATVSEDYEWYDYAGNYYDYKDRPIGFTYSLKSLVRTSAIQIMTATNADKFKEMFGVEPQRAGFLTGHVPALGLAREWWDEPYEGDK